MRKVEYLRHLRWRTTDRADEGPDGQNLLSCSVIFLRSSYQTTKPFCFSDQVRSSYNNQWINKSNDQLLPTNYIILYKKYIDILISTSFLSLPRRHHPDHFCTSAIYIYFSDAVEKNLLFYCRLRVKILQLVERQEMKKVMRSVQ